MDLFLSVFVVVLAAVGAAVVAGIYVSLSAVVIPAFLRLKPASGAIAMRSVNRTSARWPLLVVLGATAVAALVAPVLVLALDAGGPSPWWVLAGSVLTLSVFVLSVVKTIPLDRRLGSMESAEAAEFWPEYAQRWTAWNDLRAAAAGAGAVLLVVSLVA
ncbi:anthrone oxygenase family protein [Paraoerskovia marina]|uniref:Uncharacterized membrane protein n=1 Tax=Paraoerskovia marina TaxID=545619 RepID=A0A1H1U6W7_9CELL|nr:anthrone oxygenase family protein [Paraoerskovia marina]SDS67579.1 Uncharacterized membrane protein [Paraoerskovia marina]